jgi:hypothetical protein
LDILVDRLGHVNRRAELLVGVLYAKRWLRPVAPGAAIVAARDLDPLETIVDWPPVPERALAVLTGA